MFTLGTIFENFVYMWTNWAKTEGKNLRFFKNIRRLVDGASASSLLIFKNTPKLSASTINSSRVSYNIKRAYEPYLPAVETLP